MEAPKERCVEETFTYLSKKSGEVLPGTGASDKEAPALRNNLASVVRGLDREKEVRDMSTLRIFEPLEICG